MRYVIWKRRKIEAESSKVYEAEERIVVTIDGRTDKIELKSPMLVNGMLIEKEQKYLIDFVWNKNKPNEGELHMISIVE